MMDVLEVRRVRHTGQLVLSSGDSDPLREDTDPVAALGFIEAFPILPKRVLGEPPPPRNLTRLVRVTRGDEWRHHYTTVAGRPGEPGPPSALVLGSLWTIPAPGFVEMRRRPDGRLASDLLVPSSVSAAELARSAPRWVAAPLTWSRRPHAWALRATASRARHATRTVARPASQPAAAAVLGHLRATAAPGYSALFSARHPVLGDQFLTRSELEATDLGYRVEGVLGHIGDVGADRHAGPQEILWGSRFGRGRRYEEA
jgi:hypothetical protein